MLGRSFRRGESHSSQPERIVIISVLCCSMIFFNDINKGVNSILGTDSFLLTILLMVFLVPLACDLIFRMITALFGVR